MWLRPFRRFAYHVLSTSSILANPSEVRPSRVLRSDPSTKRVTLSVLCLTGWRLCGPAMCAAAGQGIGCRRRSPQYGSPWFTAADTASYRNRSTMKIGSCWARLCGLLLAIPLTRRVLAFFFSLLLLLLLLLLSLPRTLPLAEHVPLPTYRCLSDRLNDFNNIPLHNMAL